MATHSSVLAWRIPGTGEPGGPPSMGSHRVGHDWSDLAAAAAEATEVDVFLEFPCFFYDPTKEQQSGHRVTLNIPAQGVSFAVAVVQLPSRVRLFAISWTEAHQASLSFIISQTFLKLMSIESVRPSNHPILCRPPHLLPSIFPSIRVFSNESVLCIRWLKYWSFSFSISPSNVYTGLISFRIDWFDVFSVQGTLKSLLQHHSSKASILWC